MRRKSLIHAIVKPPDKQSSNNNSSCTMKRSNHKYFTSVEIFELICKYTIMKIWKFDAKKMLSVESSNRIKRLNRFTRLESKKLYTVLFHSVYSLPIVIAHFISYQRLKHLILVKLVAIIRCIDRSAVIGRIRLLITGVAPG